MLIRKLLLAALAAAAIVGVACGGGDDDPPEPTATFPPGFTPQPEGFLTPQPPPALDPNVTFARFQGEKWPYNIGYPEGWNVDAAGPSVDEFELHTDFGEVTAIHVRCARSVSEGNAEPEGLASDDLRLVSTVPYQSGDLTATEINGRRAVKWDYSVAIPGSPVRAWTFVYYIKGDDDTCAWRVSLQTIGTEPLTGYQELLDRVVQEFRPGEQG